MSDFKEAINRLPVITIDNVIKRTTSGQVAFRDLRVSYFKSATSLEDIKMGMLKYCEDGVNNRTIAITTQTGTHLEESNDAWHDTLKFSILAGGVVLSFALYNYVSKQVASGHSMCQIMNLIEAHAKVASYKNALGDVFSEIEASSVASRNDNGASSHNSLLFHAVGPANDPIGDPVFRVPVAISYV